MVFNQTNKDNYQKIFETVSEAVMDMACHWTGGQVPNTLAARQNWSERALDNFMVKENTIFPVNNRGFLYQAPEIHTEGSLMLVYDTSMAKNLLSTSLNEYPYDLCPNYDATPCFYLGFYIGWEIKFFDTMEEVEGFIKGNAQYIHYTLYYNYVKVPLRFGYFRNTQRVYCEEVDLYDHLKTAFVEAQDFFLLTLDDISDYCICHTNKDIVNTLVRMVPKESKTEKIGNAEFSLGDYRLKNKYSVEISTRHRVYKGVLVFHPEDEHPPVLTFSTNETNLPFNFALSYFNPFTSSSVGCWVECRAFEKAINGEVLVDTDYCGDRVACESCPIRKIKGFD